MDDFEVILVIIDRFSKYATFIFTTKLCYVKLTAHLFFKHVMKLWGVPSSIVSDMDDRYIGTFWAELFAFLGTNMNISSRYHPQTDSQTERFNCMLENYLDISLIPDKRIGSDCLMWLNFVLRDFCKNNKKNYDNKAHVTTFSKFAKVSNLNLMTF